MKNILIVVSVALSLTCCVPDKKDNSLSIENQKVTVVENEKPYGELNQPAYFMGTDFMSFMQSCSRIGDYDRMIKFTHSSSVRKYGTDKLKNFYENVNFNYQIQLKSMTTNDDSTFTLHYVSNRFATKGTIKFKIAIENDSCKLVLPNNLSEFAK